MKNGSVENRKMKRILRLILLCLLFAFLWNISASLYLLRDARMNTAVILRLPEGEHQFRFSIPPGGYFAALVYRTDSGGFGRMFSSEIETAGIDVVVSVFDPDTGEVMIQENIESLPHLHFSRRMAYREHEMSVFVKLPDSQLDYVYLRLSPGI